MKFFVHLAAQIVVFAAVYTLAGLQTALLVVLFHFIPSLDFAMKKIDFHPELHRQLFHNVFALAIASVAMFYFVSWQTAVLGALNFLLHLTMDLGGNGVALFFPLSQIRIKLAK